MTGHVVIRQHFVIVEDDVAERHGTTFHDAEPHAILGGEQQSHAPMQRQEAGQSLRLVGADAPQKVRLHFLRQLAIQLYLCWFVAQFCA